MKRIYFLILALLLAGCANVEPEPTSRIYDSEPADKVNTATLEPGGIKGWIRPLHADHSVEVLLANDDVWVSGGMFTVLYACLTGNQTLDSVHSYPHEETINIAPGYRYWVECDENSSKLKIWNDSASRLDFHTSSEAAYIVTDMIRHPKDTPGGTGFGYSYYNDWGGADDIDFQIYKNYETKLLTAHLAQYHGSVMYLAMEAYDKGARTRDAMMKALAPNEFDADVKSCPKLQDYFDELQKEFTVRANKPREQEKDYIYTDSPPIYHYYLDIGNDATVSLSLLDEKGALYQTTQDAMTYLKSCSAKDKK